MQPRLVTEEMEIKMLSQFATKACESRGRERPEEQCGIRTVFQRDRDRIIHSKAFRRLKHKTQVFLIPDGDHYRTRLTHTLEVSQVARTISRALRLNEDLTEAIALGHDLGHTAFGHAGEEVLDEIHPGGFRHNEQSLRVVDVLEKPGGLNLTWEVRDGILKHCDDLRPETLEGQVVKLSDKIAYINHDIDDAIRGGVLSHEDLPSECIKILGDTHRQRINTMVVDVIHASRESLDIKMSAEIREATFSLRDFLFREVYIDSEAKREETKAKAILKDLYYFYVRNPEHIRGVPACIAEHEVRQLVCDYVAGMTDRFAVDQYRTHFLPAAWKLEF